MEYLNVVHEFIWKLIGLTSTIFFGYKVLTREWPRKKRKRNGEKSSDS